MDERLWLIVSGSRDWDHPDLIRDWLAAAADRRPGLLPVVVHGQCPPRLRGPLTARHPIFIRWGAALTWEEDKQRQGMLGADWHAHLAAVDLGWPEEGFPADWRHGGRRAGTARNTVMIVEMHDRPGEARLGGFPNPCIKPEHARKAPHDSHGTAHALKEARRILGPAQVDRIGPPLPDDLSELRLL